MRRFLINLLRIAVIAGNVLPFNAALAQAASRPDYRPAPPTEVLPAPNPFAPFAPAGGALEAFAPRPAPLLPPARPQPRPANVDTGYALTPGAALPRPAGLSLSKPAILNLARTAPAPVKGAEVLPSWFKTVPATEPAPPIFPLPEWFASIDQSQFSIINESTPPPPALANRASSNANPLLPEWFARPVNTARGVLPEWFAPPALPPAAPAARPLAADIPESLLSIEIFGPPVASVGAPAGFGEVYTAVIRNDSSSPPQTAYNVYLKALLPGFFIHDGGDSLISPTGSIPFNLVTGGSVITWTPVSTLNLAPGDVITLNFKLRTTCGVQSGQRMEIQLYYNADPTQPPVEVNNSGFNITTGRGNLVIKKEPAIQTLGTPDFGQPITWIVTVQNTGLGKIYSATVRDNGGVNLAAPSGTPALPDVIPLLDVNEVKTYTVVGVVESCNFTNEPEAYWSCGNLVNGAVKDGTITNPVSSTASVLFNPTLPNLSIEVSSPITFPYCSIVARTVSVTVTNTGGPAGDFRLDSGLESDGFLELVPGSVSAGWQYVAASGLFSYTGGSPTGTLAGGSVLTLSFDVRPQASACAAGNGDLTFTPLYRNICDSTPFTGTPVVLRYEYARQNAPTLNIQKTGPDVVEPGGVYTYQIVISGTNPGSINGNVFVTDVLPSEFALQGILGASAGVAATSGQTVTWNFDPGNTLGTTFVQTLTYQIRVDDTVGGGICGASQSFSNNAEAFAGQTCPTCPPLNPATQVDTIVINNEGVSVGDSGAASLETCGPGGFTLSSNYSVSGGTVVTWTGAVYTEALGTFGAGALPGPVYMQYVPGTLTVTVYSAATGKVDYTAFVTVTVTAGGQLRLELDNLQAAGAPTQNLTLYFTYTALVTDAALAGAVSQDFNDWHRLFLPGASDAGACTGNGTFNNFIPLNISRGDLQVNLDPPVLNRCETNVVTLNVTGGDPARRTDNVVVTFTATTAEIQSIIAHGVFTYSGGLNAIGPAAVTNNPNTGGGQGVITFTFPAANDLNANGAIQFLLDVPCTGDSVWNAGVTFRSLCLLPYGNTTAQPHTYRAPNLTLFVTPVEYTVRNKQAEWKFFVANSGNLTATNVVITNALSGISVVSYTVNPPAGVTLSGTLPITAPAPVVFTITELAPNTQYEFYLTGTIFSCIPLEVNVTARDDCFGSACDLLQGSVQFNTPDPYLLTNNGQTADLPTCDIGHVEFTTKNASPDVSLYQLNITETLEYLDVVQSGPFAMTIEDETGAVLVTTLNFTPAIQVGPTQTLLIWKVISAPTEVLTYFEELPALYVVRVQIPVRTGCTVSKKPTAAAKASARGPCDNQLGYQENAVTLRTAAPNLVVEKDGKVLGGDFGDAVYANPGDTVIWRLTVRNNPAARSYVARNVKLYDTWPQEFQFIAATNNATYPYQLSGTNTISWNLGDIQDDGTPYVFLITGTIPTANNVCTLAATNTTRVTFGCDYNGCTGDVVPQDTANLVTRPNLEAFVPPDPLLTCGGDITVRITNRGTAAYSTALTVTIPAGYVYSETVGSTITPDLIIPTGQAPVWVWDPITIPGRAITAPFAPYVFNLVFRVQSTGTTGVCPVPDGQILTAELRYNDDPTCTATGAFTDTFARALNVVTPSLSLDKTPRAQVGQVGGVISWTVTLTNAGAGDAPDNIVVTDVVGTNFTNILVSNGSDGSTPVLQSAGGVTTITWQLLPTFTLQANGANTWQAIITATLLATGTNINNVEARATCDSGCRYTNVARDSAFVTVQDLFLKTGLVSTATVGDLVTFTLAAKLNDQNGTYSNMVITDALPPGLGYVSATMQYTTDAEPGGAQTQFLTSSTTAPPPLQTGNIIWNLGNVPGQVHISATVVALVIDDPSNQNGASQNNQFLLSYQDDGGTGITETFVFTSGAAVDIQVPVMHIQKTYLTGAGCNATLLDDNFNDGTTGGWTALNAGVSVSPEGFLHLQNSGDIENNTQLSDFSWSFMARRNPGSTGNLLPIFRSAMGGNNFSQNSYRLDWTDTRLRLRKYVNGTLSPIASTTPPPEALTWHHFEIRAEGPHIQIFVNGSLKLDVTDGSHLTGTSQIRTTGGSDFNIDDMLFTRIQDSACYVGAGDLVTYTLTISSHETLPGYNLVITDTMPPELNFLASTWDSTAFPPDTNTAAPLAGATAPLTWGFSSLSGTGTVPPLVADQHTLVITVSARVTDGVEANTFFSNQAFLAYDNRNDGGLDLSGTYGITTRTVRTASGGSHSTGLRTVGPSLTKTVIFGQVPTATLGSVISYLIVLPAPPITAALYDVTVTDRLDARLALQTVSAPPDGAPVSAGNAFTVTYPFIAARAQRRITVTAIISDPLGAVAGDVITNQATLNHRTGTPTTSNQTAFTVTEPSLSLLKVSDPPAGSTVGAGDPVTYTVRVTNASGITVSGAYDIVFSDTLPVGMRQTTPTLIAATLNGLPVAAGDYLTGYNALSGLFSMVFTPAFNIPPAGVLLIRYRARVDAGVAAGVVMRNLVTTTWNSYPGDQPGDRQYGPITGTVPVQTGAPTLTLRKTVAVPFVAPGDPLTYTLRVTNSGQGSATGVVITDMVPANTHFVTATTPFSGPGAGNVITWTVGALNAGQSVTVTMVVTVDRLAASGTQIVNTGWLTSGNDGGGSDTVTTPVRSQHTLALVKSVVPAVVSPGSVLTYTLDWSVSGSEAAPNVTISDTVPANTGFITATRPVTVNGARLTWPLGTVIPPAGGSVTFTVRVAGPLVSGTVIANAAIITDSTNLSGTASVTTPVQSSHALTLTKSATPSVVRPGQAITYTLNWAVSGNEPAVNLTISDTVPANTGFITASRPVTVNGARLTWPLGTVNPPAGGFVTVSVRVDFGVVSGTVIANVAVITDRQNITGTAAVTTPVTDKPALSLRKTVTDADGGLLRPGDRLTYTLRVSNTGGLTATGVAITDTVPANTTYVAGSIAGGDSRDDTTLPLLRWTVASLPPGAVVTVSFAVTLGLPLTNGLRLTNTAAATASNVPTQTTSTVTSTVVSTHALSLRKTVTPAVVSAGDVLTYSLAFTVSGDEPVFNLTISDTTPTGTTFVAAAPAPSSAPPVGGTGAVIWQLGNFLTATSGITRQSGQVTLTVRLDTPFGGGTEVINTARITDSSAATDTDTITTPVQAGHTLSLTKEAAPRVATAGGLLTYSLRYSIAGAGPATNVTLSDTTPAGVTFAAAIPAPATAPPVGGMGTVVWALGTVNPPAGGVVTMVVRVNRGVPSGTVIANVAIITDSSAVTDTGSVTTPVLVPGMVIVKRVSVPAGAFSATVRYAIEITNTGQISISPVRLTDTLPGALAYVPGSFAPFGPTTITPLPGGGTRLYWANVTTQPLQPGQSTSVLFDARVSTRITGTYRNVVTAAGLYPGGVVTDTGEVPIAVRDPAVELTKMVAAPGRAVNGLITFTIRLTNIGPTTLSVVPMFDFFTGPVVYAGGRPPADVVNNAAGLLVWNDLTQFFGDMVPGQSFVVSTIFSLTTTTDTFSMTNTAVVTNAVDENGNDANDDDDTVIHTGPTAVQLLYFRAEQLADGILLRWATAVEFDNFGFRLLRSLTGLLPDALEVAFVPGQGHGTNTGAVYQYLDRDVTRGKTYTYWLVDVDLNGAETYHGPRTVPFDLLHKMYLPLILKE